MRRTPLPSFNPRVFPRPSTALFFLFLLGEFEPAPARAGNYFKDEKPSSHARDRIPPSRTRDHTAPQRIREAETAYASGQWKAAADHYRAFLEDFSDHPSAQSAVEMMTFRLLDCQLRLDEPKEALETLEVIFKLPEPPGSKKSPATIRALVLVRAKLNLKLSIFQKAREDFEAWLETIPDPPQKNHNPKERDEAIVGLGACLLGENRPLDAATHLERSARLLRYPHSLQTARLLRIRCSLALHNPKEAWGFLNSHADSFRNAHFCESYTHLLWETATGLTSLKERDAQLSALACLKRIAANRYNNPGTRDPTPQNEHRPHDSNRERSTRENLPHTEWHRLLLMGDVLEFLERTADHVLVLECARAHAPDKSARDAIDLKRLLKLKHLCQWAEVESGAHQLLLSSPRESMIPEILLLRATAETEQQSFQAAGQTLEELEKRFHRSPLVARARLLKAHGLLLAGDTPLCLRELDRFDAFHPKHELHSHALLTRIQALLHQKSYQACRETAHRFARTYPGEGILPVALLCSAIAAHAESLHPEAIISAKACLNARPQPGIANHALLLCGQSLALCGESQKAIETLDQITPDTPDIAWAAALESATILRKLNDIEALKNLWIKTAHHQPHCPHLADIARWILAYTKSAPKDPLCKNSENELSAAVEVLVKVPRCENAAQLLDLLISSRPNSGTPADQTRIREMINTPLHIPGGSLMKLHALRHALAGQDVRAREQDLTDAIQLAFENLHLVPASILEFLAEAASESPNEPTRDRSHRIWWELLRWNPKARQRDKALLAIGIHAARRGDFAAASEAFSKALRTAATPQITPRIRLERARLHVGVCNSEESEKDLLAVLGCSEASPQLRADALLLLGEKHMQDKKPERAIACFQRVYILYPSCSHAVAAAYLRSGEAFESLQDIAAARRTYAELLAQENLSDQPQFLSARKKLQALPP